MQCCTGCGPPTGDLQTIQLLNESDTVLASGVGTLTTSQGLSTTDLITKFKIKIISHNGEAFGEEEYAIAVKKGNTELLNQINASIQKMLDDGTISSLSAEYLDKDTTSEEE